MTRAITSLAVLGLLSPALASAGTAKASLTVSATVVARVLVTQESHPGTVTISPEDVARGWVDVKGATHLQLRTNAANGYLLAFESSQSWFTDVQVMGAGSDVSLGAGNGWVFEPFLGTTVNFELGYRFNLAPGLQPGSYPWPLSVTARTL